MFKKYIKNDNWRKVAIWFFSILILIVLNSPAPNDTNTQVAKPPVLKSKPTAEKPAPKIATSTATTSPINIVTKTATNTAATSSTSTKDTKDAKQKTSAAIKTKTETPQDPYTKTVKSEVRPVAKEHDNVTINTSLYKVVKVIDGDTVKLNMNGTVKKVRIIGINTPEINHPSKPVECMGTEAAAKARELLAGQTVRFETDPTQDTYDKYGRLLGYVFLPDGRNYGEIMIREGYAYEYTYSSPYKYQTLYKKAQRYAKDNKLGLWAGGACSDNTSTIENKEKPTPALTTKAAVTSDRHKWYVSSYRTSKFYYCDTDDGWKGLSKKYLEVYDSEKALKDKYPDHTLHEACQ